MKHFQPARLQDRLSAYVKKNGTRIARCRLPDIAASLNISVDALKSAAARCMRDDAHFHREYEKDGTWTFFYDPFSRNELIDTTPQKRFRRKAPGSTAPAPAPAQVACHSSVAVKEVRVLLPKGCYVLNGYLYCTADQAAAIGKVLLS